MTVNNNAAKLIYNFAEQAIFKQTASILRKPSCGERELIASCIPDYSLDPICRIPRLLSPAYLWHVPYLLPHSEQKPFQKSEGVKNVGFEYV
ncbi:hypothetical protein Mapa_009616 [Marchantia paleacea]|nr:hypothetical protein Mapa_009616 [Marchantia paleacea]